MSDLRRVLFWLPWPPPWPVWLAAAIIIVVAVAFMFAG